MRGDRHPAVDPPDPAVLVRRAAAGDRDAWDALVRRYVAMIHSICRAYRLPDHDAADVNQVVWLRLVEHLDRLRDPAAVGGWIAAAARNECLRVLRQAGRTSPVDHDDLDRADPGPAPDALLLEGETHAAVREAFARLNPRCQALLRILMAEPRPSYDEVAAALGIPIGSIGPTRARCLDHLRRRLERVSSPSPEHP